MRYLDALVLQGRGRLVTSRLSRVAVEFRPYVAGDGGSFMRLLTNDEDTASIAALAVIFCASRSSP